MEQATAFPRLGLRLALALIALLPNARAGADEDLTKKRIVYSVPGMDHVSVQRGLRYVAADGTSLPMDVYAPAGLGASERRPAVVLVHGGPITPAMTPHDWGVYRSYGELLAASGFVAVTFTHRLYGIEHYARSAGDVSAVIETVRARSAALHVDPDRLAIWGFSGGGPLVSVAFRKPPAYIRAVCSYYGLLDLNGGPPEYRQVPAELSPLQQLRESPGPLPPILIARGALDDPWINRTVDAFVAVAIEKNLTLDLLTLPTGHHAFDIRDNEERSRQVIKATLFFLQAELGLE